MPDDDADHYHVLVTYPTHREDLGYRELRAATARMDAQRDDFERAGSTVTEAEGDLPPEVLRRQQVTDAEGGALAVLELKSCRKVDHGLVG